ncbi:MAG: preprotein translocase subunit SecE [Actinomycetota bacterium]
MRKAKEDNGKTETKLKAVKAKATEQTMPGMTREMKRAMAKREGSADRLKRPAPKAKRERTKPSVFLKEVRGELARVAWPSRQEVIVYSFVVLITVAFFMIVVSAIDLVALKGVLYLLDLRGS